MPKPKLLLRIAAHALLRPTLWPVLVRTAWRFRRRGWWRRPPFLPVPPAEYMAWRLHTAYGDGGREPETDEVMTYVRWADRLARGRREDVQVR